MILPGGQEGRHDTAPLGPSTSSTLVWRGAQITRLTLPTQGFQLAGKLSSIYLDLAFSKK